MRGCLQNTQTHAEAQTHTNTLIFTNSKVRQLQITQKMPVFFKNIMFGKHIIVSSCMGFSFDFLLSVFYLRLSTVRTL